MKAPPIINPARRPSAWWWTVALPATAVVLVLFLFNPSHYSFYPRCLLYTMTGIYCPGCGSLRAMHQLSHGHLVTALRCNLPLVLSLPFFAVYGVNWLRCWRAGAPLPRCVPTARWIKILVVVLVLFTILRNIPCAPFIWLTPP